METRISMVERAQQGASPDEGPDPESSIERLSLSESELHSLLAEHGYVWVVRHNGWFECLVSREHERWEGSGATAGAALEDALNRMLPSALARKLLSGQLRGAEATPSVEAQGDTEATPPTPKKVAARATEDTKANAKPPRADAKRSGHGAKVKTAPASTNNEPRVKRFPGPPATALRRSDEDVAELEVLEDRLAALLPDIAGFSRDLQRLGFIAFIARARQISQRTTSDPRVETVVRRIAGRLGELAEQFWPGSVRALQLRATPLQAGADMDLQDGGRLHDWAEAAEAAEQLIENKRQDLDRRGFDDSGWADVDRCFPPPNDPDSRLDELRNAMEKLFGRLDQKSGSDVDRRLQHNADKLMPDLLRWGRELRWLRPHAEDRVRWGQALGRLRWAVTRIPREHRPMLDTILYEEHRPSKPWAHELGEDPVAKQRKKKRKALLQKKPEGARATPEAVSRWLAEAFELGDHFSTTEIAERISEWNPVVLGLSADDASQHDRKYRRRLKQLQDEIERRERGDTEPPKPQKQSDGDAEIRIVERDEGDLHFRRLLARVRERIEGKSALFVSNRPDPMLKERLERELGVQIDWTEIDPRRIQSRIESVRQMSYDLVMSATGFQGHSIDATLGRETKARGLPYVRVNRGRLTTCVRALARQFGLLEAA